jgi:DNA-directed RNA polymerase subunit RPC12/RpoP
MSIYKCIECSIEFKTNSGLWKHNKTKHTNIIELNNCKYCNKELSDRHSKWRHENKTCKKKSDNKSTEIKSVKEISGDINIKNLNKSNVSINQIENKIENQNNINVTLNFNAIGSENVLELTEEERELILNDGLNSITTLVKYLNFNKNLPQNHTFCNTNLNNKYISALNTDTKEIEKHRKIDYFDKVLLYSIAHLKILNHNISNQIKKDSFTEKIIEIEKYLYQYDQSNIKKIYLDQINALSYNKRKYIQNTWNQLLLDDLLNI